MAAAARRSSRGGEVKLHSAPLDDVLNELDLVLSELRTPAARLLREVRQRAKELRAHGLRMLRAVNRGELTPRRRAR
jgi:hypothetical protein